MSEEDGISIGELSRQVRDVLVRFNGLVNRLEEKFVNKDLLDLTRENIYNNVSNVTNRVESLEHKSVDKAEYQSLVDRVSQLEDDKKWLYRLVFGFIILGILGAIFLTASPGGVTP